MCSPIMSSSGWVVIRLHVITHSREEVAIIVIWLINAFISSR